MALQGELAETSARAKCIKLHFGAERKVVVALQTKVTGLERSMAELKARIEAEKTAASLAYFQERSEELVNMGVELLTEGREAG